MLHRLKEYADGLNLPPAMYKKTAVPWIVDLDGDGRLLGFVPTSSGKKKDRGKELVVPHPGSRTSGIKANLLADKAEYALGVYKDNKSRERHQAFVALVNECLNSTGDPAVAAVVRFLAGLEKGIIEIPEEITSEQWVTFRVNDRLVTDIRAVQEFWYRSHMAGDGSLTECIICGELRQPVSPHPVNIKGIPGGQTSGLALISANSSAFESYGLEKSLIAPTCHECAERYATAINKLINQEETHYRIGSLMYLFWTRKGSFSPVSLFRTADPGEVKALLESVKRGRDYTAIDEDAFYATALSASGGRVVVRQWLETTVGEVRRYMARWFRLQGIVENNGDPGSPIPLFNLAASLYHDANRDMHPNVPRVLLDVALKGGPLPRWLLYLAVKRNRAEQGITRPRAALIKMVLLSWEKMKGDEEMEKLESQNSDPAYLCGRLLAELEAVQRAVMPGTNTTIVDRFFGTASSAPASVFGRLLRGAQYHLGKLRKTSPGTCHALQERLEEIQSRLTYFPKVLTLEQQALFALGYYHQRAADRAAARAHAQKKAAGEDITNSLYLLHSASKPGED
ncbi:MAG TPA: type I-C CRISPR-associated protein Cas8c/Csd1 [Desulfotomaculum sp.]|nr:type I-C CRISPR-associated protein Cas8c/Csd1 [Desulfotomaculum sp.]